MLHGTIQGQVTYLWGPEVKRSSYRNLTASAMELSTFLHEGYFPSCALFCNIDKINVSRWFSGKESSCQCRRLRRCGFNPWVRKIPWRKKWQPTPVLLPGKSMNRGAKQATYSPWGCGESDMTELPKHAQLT